MNPVYTAVCVFGGSLRYFYELRPEAESHEVPVGGQAQAPVKRCQTQNLHLSAFADERWFNIRISPDGRGIRFSQDFWLRFKGARQWQIIDALFAAWKDGFGKKANIGRKTEIEKVFSSKPGKCLMRFIHFETREEAGLAKVRGNCQYTGNAWFDRKLIYPENLPRKKE